MQQSQAGGKATQRASSILVVEDNAAMRALIRSLVEELASVVHECGRGDDAVDLYARIRPDCVVMDIRLPGLDGLAATRAIRRLDPGARVVIVTEFGDEQYRRAAEAAGARGFVLKEDLLTLRAELTSAIPLGASGR